MQPSPVNSASEHPSLVILFDIDGTLIRTGGAGGAALQSAMQATFPVPQPEMVTINGRTDRGIITDLFRANGIDDTPENLKIFHAQYMEHLLPALQARAGRVLPGVLSLLDRLIDRPEVDFGLLTGNSRDGARLKLAHFGLEDYFHWGVFGDEHHERDDLARRAFLEVRNRLHPDYEPHRIWVIGDTPADIRCARAIGACVIAVATGQHPVEELQTHAPDLVLPDLSQPELLLDLWGLSGTTSDPVAS